MLSPNLEASGAKMQPLSRRSSSRLSLSELGGSVDRPNFSLADIDTLGKSPVTSRLLVLASPTPASKELNDDPTPPRRRSSVHRWGTSGVAISPQLQRRTSEPLSPLPNQPTRLYTEHEVYAELRKSEQEVPISLQDTLDHLKQDSSSSSSDNNTALPISEHGSGGVMELSGDILLPFADRREVKDVLLNSVHKSICDLLRSDSNTWSKVMKLLDIPRDVMNDQAWITELKAIIYPKGESLWHRVGTAIGIDPEDAAVTPQEDYNTVMWIEPLVHGDSLLEGEQVNERRKSFGTCASSMLSPSMPFAMDLPASPSQTQARLNDTASMSSRLNERKMSNGSLRSSSSFVNTNLGSIAEDNTAAGGFPEPTQPPKKINFELLAEQERQLAAEQDRMPSAGWRTRAGSGSQAGVSPVPPSVDPDEEYDSPEELKRSLSGRSLRSNGNSSTRRLRGLRFTTCSTREDPNLPQPSSPQLSFRKDLFSKSLGSQSDYAIESESEGGESARLHSLSRSSSLGNTCQPRRKLRFGFGSAGEQRGPAVLA